MTFQDATPAAAPAAAPARAVHARTAAATSPKADVLDPVSPATKTCRHCGWEVSDTAVICVHCGSHLKSGFSAKTLLAGRKTSRVGLALLASAGGAIAGGAIWGLVAIVTDYELGIVAWAVGWLAGLGVTMFTERRGVVMGLAAAFLAVFGIFFGKFMISYHVASQMSGLRGFFEVAVLEEKMAHDRSFPADIQGQIDQAGSLEKAPSDVQDRALDAARTQLSQMSDEERQELLTQSMLADDEAPVNALITEMAKKKEGLPPDLLDKIEKAGDVYALEEEDFKRVEQVARERVARMNEDERRALVAASVATLQSLQTYTYWFAVAAGTIASFFGCFQILFVGLAVMTAYKLGYSGIGTA